MVVDFKPNHLLSFLALCFSFIYFS